MTTIICDDLIIYILTFVDYPDFFNFANTCRYYKNLSQVDLILNIYLKSNKFELTPKQVPLIDEFNAFFFCKRKSILGVHKFVAENIGYHSFLCLPKINLDNYKDTVNYDRDYIDYIKLNDVNHPISMGIDPRGRLFVVLRYRSSSDNRLKIITIFNRYADSPDEWVNGTCYYPKCFTDCYMQDLQITQFKNLISNNIISVNQINYILE